MNFLKNKLLSIFVVKDAPSVQTMSFPLRVKNECPEEGEIREYSVDVWKRELIMLDFQPCGLKFGIRERTLKRNSRKVPNFCTWETRLRTVRRFRSDSLSSASW